MKTADILLPEKFIYSVEIPVRIYDINYGNHLGHDSLISILHEARVSFLNQHHLSELNIFNLCWIMSSLNILYQNQAFYGDLLEVSIAIDSISKTSFCFVYRVTKRNANGKTINIAKAKTKMTFFDYKTNKVRKIPQQYLELIS